MSLKADKLPKWFFDNNTDKTFADNLAEFKGKKKLRFLQIGCFSGNSSRWLLSEILTAPDSTLVDVDPWCGNVEHEVYEWDFVESAYDEQVEPYGKKVEKHKEFSQDYLANHRDERFDFIYIDGDHLPEAAYADGVNSWDLLKVGGLMAFDDYEWQHPKGFEYNPKPAIDKFMREHKDDSEVVSIGWQVWLRKVK